MCFVWIIDKEVLTTYMQIADGYRLLNKLKPVLHVNDAVRAHRDDRWSYNLSCTPIVIYELTEEEEKP